MSEQKDSKEKADTEINEKDVLSYLTRYPDLLMKHSDLLERLQVPHSIGKGTVSLIERQVEILRDKNRHQEDRLLVLINNAEQNEATSQKLHHYSLVLSATSNIDELLKNAVPELRHQFNLAAVSIHIQPEYQDDVLQTSGLSEKAFSALFDTLGKEACVCQNSLDDELLQALFGEQAPEVKSCALLSLNTPHRVGLIALGASERERFTPKMGTLILTRLAELFSSSLKRSHDFSMS